MVIYEHPGTEETGVKGVGGERGGSGERTEAVAGEQGNQQSGDLILVVAGGDWLAWLLSGASLIYVLISYQPGP